MCAKCKRQRENNQFGKHALTSSGKHPWCKECLKKYNREYQKMRRSERTPEQLKNEQLKCRFGITLNKYNIVLAAQDGVCAICQKPETKLYKGKIMNLCVDHNHITGQIRGLLCNRCNRSIGLLEDNTQLLKRAYEYLKSHES